MSQSDKKVVSFPHACDAPIVPERPLDDDVNPMRMSFIRSIENTWVNGTKITYCFLKGRRYPSSWAGNASDKDAVRRAFDVWKNVGIGLEFEEVDDPEDASVRIGFQQGGGSWSYMGTYVLRIPVDERTMNFGWSLDEGHGFDTALHEIGHTLGAPHEHQNPKAGIQWNEAEVYRYFRGSPNFWTDDKIHHNILRKLPERNIDGSNWDPDSVMHYSFRAPLIDGPSPYDNRGISPPGGLSDDDKAWVKKFYPPLQVDNEIELKPYKSHRAKLAPGDQLDFIIKPAYSRKYRMQTFGNVDTLLVLFEKDGDREVYLSGDDDSGYGTNARIDHRLIRGRTYILRLRFYYSSEDGETAVMLW